MDGLSDEVLSSTGIRITDRLRFFKGDKPAAQFEAGITCGGNYPCVACVCHRNSFADFPHAVKCEQRTLQKNLKVATGGHFGKVPGKIKYYEELNTNQLRIEFEKRGVKDYPSDKKGRLNVLKEMLWGVQRVPSLLMMAPESSLDEFHLDSYSVLPCEPLHDLKGYLGAVFRQLPSVLGPSRLKTSLCDYFSTLCKKANLYGSDLRKALVDVAHIFHLYDTPSTVATFICCLVQLSNILYSKDSNRSPKQCLQFYNCAYIVHELHCELFGDTMISNYFHALLVHGPMQHEVVSCRSTNTENEERIFKSAESAAKCTDHKPENMLPGILKRLQCKRNQKTSNPLLKLRKENSRISQSASKLPPYPGTIFKEEFINRRTYSYKAHLKRISPYLKCGEGVWWHRDSCGSFCFHDSQDGEEISSKGPELLHFRNASMEDVAERSESCWKEVIEKKITLPIIMERENEREGNISDISSANCVNVSSEPEFSFEATFIQPILASPKSSTPNRKTIQSEESSEASENGEDGFVQKENSNGNDEQDPNLNTEGTVDVQVDEILNSCPEVSLESSVCKAIAKLLGSSTDLNVFDQLRCMYKQGDRHMLPSQKERYHSLARYFRKKISAS